MCLPCLLLTSKWQCVIFGLHNCNYTNGLTIERHFFLPLHLSQYGTLTRNGRENSNSLAFESEKSSVDRLAEKQPRAANALVPWYVRPSVNSSPQHLLVPHACHRIHCSQVSHNHPMVGPPFVSCLTNNQRMLFDVSPRCSSQVCPRRSAPRHHGH
jgi:hypothetical protein